MIKRLKVNLINSLGLFAVFFTIFLLYSVIVSAVISYKQILDNNKGFFSKDSMSIYLNVPKEVNKDKVLDVFSKEKGVIIGTNYSYEDKKDSLLVVKGLWFNEKPYKEPPVISGRFLSKNDFNDNSAVAVIGKKYMDKIEVVNGDKYLIFKNNKYKVVGIIGYKNDTSFYDNWCVINLKYHLMNIKDFYSALSDEMEVDNINGGIENNLSSMGKNFNKVNSGISLNVNSNTLNGSNTLIVAIGGLRGVIKLFLISIILLFVNIINVAFFWVEKRRKEIGIRKAFGATNGDIIRNIMVHFQIITFVSACLAISTHMLLKKYEENFTMLKNIGTSNSVYGKTFICLIAFSMIIGLISSIIPVNYILKQEANDIIRER